MACIRLMINTSAWECGIIMVPACHKQLLHARRQPSYMSMLTVGVLVRQ